MALNQYASRAYLGLNAGRAWGLRVDCRPARVAQAEVGNPRSRNLVTPGPQLGGQEATSGLEG